MWIFTSCGYVSAVEHKDDPTALMIRSRDHTSLRVMLEAMGRTKGEIYTAFPSDYPYRVVVAREEFADWVAHEARMIDYVNFKKAATEDRGKQYHDVLMSIWSVTHRLTPAKVRRRNDIAWDKKWAKARSAVARFADTGKRRVDSLFSEDDRLQDALDTLPDLHAMTDAEWREFESTPPTAPPF